VAEATLYYAAGRGFAEPIRLALDYLGIDWREETLRTPAAWTELKAAGRAPFGQFPILEIDGRRVAELSTILRTLFRRGGIEGVDETQRVCVDMWTARVLAFRPHFASRIFRPAPHESLEELYAERVPAELRRWEAALAGRMRVRGKEAQARVGVIPTRSGADLVIYEALSWLREESPSCLEGFEQLRALFDAVDGDPLVRRFMDSDRHYPLPDPDYVAEVQALSQRG